ncbi:MAG: HAMP domain-containing sensor histidine kinase [Saprospiraceae bacterium]
MYSALKDYIKAEQYFVNRLNIMEKRGLSMKIDGYRTLLGFYHTTGMPQKVDSIILDYLALQDSFLVHLNRDKFAEFEVKFNVKEKEMENTLLEHQNVAQRQKLNLLYIIGTLLLILIGGFIYFLLRLKQYADTISISNTYKDQILNVMGHDIRTPLLSQMMLTQDLMSEMPNKPETQQLYNLSLSVFKISDNVYNLVKKTSNVAADRDNICHLYNELLLVLDQYDPIIETKKLHLVYAPRFKDIIIAGDRIGIQAVIRNLVDNSVKYSPLDGDIEIEISRDDNYAYFEIKNKTMKPDEQSLGLYGKKGMGINIIKEILNYNLGDLKFAGYQDDMFKTIVQFSLCKTCPS